MRQRYACVERSRGQSWQSAIRDAVVFWRTDDIGDALGELYTNRRYGLDGIIVDLDQGRATNHYYDEPEKLDGDAWLELTDWNELEAYIA